MIKPGVEQCHVGSKHYNHSKIKIIITRGIHRKAARKHTSYKLIQNALTLRPIAEVWVDTESNTITKVIDLPESERYTSIPEPVF
jgi:hypothetical protein